MVGQMLVAPPAQTDEYWEKTVIFLYEQNKQNTIGVIVNKPSDRPLSDLARHQDIEYHGDEMLYLGGPVNPSALVMLHTDDWRCSNTMHISDALMVSSDRSMLTRICSGDAPRKWRLFLGMSAWANSQLIGEIQGIPPWNKKTAWVPASAEESIVFGKDPDRAWKRSIDLAAKDMVSSYFNID
jgi:putative transcriptional regulator